MKLIGMIVKALGQLQPSAETYSWAVCLPPGVPVTGDPVLALVLALVLAMLLKKIQYIVLIIGYLNVLRGRTQLNYSLDSFLQNGFSDGRFWIQTDVLSFYFDSGGKLEHVSEKCNNTDSNGIG